MRWMRYVLMAALLLVGMACAQSVRPKPGNACPRINWAHPLAQGLVAYWPMTEGSGGVVHDIGPSHDDGAFASGTAAPTWTGTLFGWGTNYTASSSQYWACSHPFHVQSPFTEFVVARFVPNGGGFNMFLSGGSGAFYSGFNSNSMMMFAGGTVTAGTATTDQQWHGFAYIKGLAAESLYQDAVVMGTLVNSTAVNATATLYFSTYSQSVGADTFNGQIALCAFWSRALSPQEVAQISADPWCVLMPGGRRRGLGN